MSVEIRFDGRRYGYWQSVSIRESVDDLCAGVRLDMTRPGAGDGLGITANTVIDVLADGDLVTRVRPDVLRRQVGADSHNIRIEARSLARELVDCTLSKTIKGATLAGIAKTLCGAFGVGLKAPQKTAVVPEFSMQAEIPANALINAARGADLLLYPQPDGGLILAPPTDAAPVATLTYGVDLLNYAVVDEWRIRYSEYRVKGYDHAANRGHVGVARDAGIAYHRPMQIVADRHGHGVGGCERRAEMERTRRQARAHRLDLAVQGWRHAAGIWAVNTQVRVVIPQEGIDGVYFIGERELSLDEQGGHITQLTVMPRAAFLGQTQVKNDRRGSGGAR